MPRLGRTEIDGYQAGAGVLGALLLNCLLVGQLAEFRLGIKACRFLVRLGIATWRVAAA